MPCAHGDLLLLAISYSYKYSVIALGHADPCAPNRVWGLSTPAPLLLRADVPAGSNILWNATIEATHRGALINVTGKATSAGQDNLVFSSSLGGETDKTQLWVSQNLTLPNGCISDLTFSEFKGRKSARSLQLTVSPAVHSLRAGALQSHTESALRGCGRVGRRGGQHAEAEPPVGPCHRGVSEAHLL